MIFGTNTTRDISKLSQLRITILKYHSWYLRQISLQIMLLPIQIKKLTERLEIQNFPSKHFRIFHGMSTQKLREEKISYHRTAM